MRTINKTSPKSIIKYWIRTADKRKAYSFSLIYAGAKELIDYEYGENNVSVKSIVRRYLEAKAELQDEFNFIPVKNKSAENYFRIIKK